MANGGIAGGFIAGLQAANKEAMLKEDSARADEKMQLLQEESSQRRANNDSQAKYREAQIKKLNYDMKLAKKKEREEAPLRAAKYKMATQAMADMMGAEVQSGGEAQQVSQLQNEVTQLKTAVVDKAAVDEDTKVWTEYTDAMAMGRRVTDLKPYNNIVQSNPAYQTIVKHSVVFYNESDDTHVLGMKKLTEKMLKLQGYDSKKMDPQDYANITEITQNALVDSARKGYMVSDSITGEMYSITAPMHLSGGKDRVPQHLQKAAGETVSNMSKVAADNVQVKVDQQEKQKSMYPWHDREAKKKSKGKKLYNGHDAEKLEQAYNLASDVMGTMPTELKEILKHNAELVTDTDKDGKSGFWDGATKEEHRMAFNETLAGVVEKGVADPADVAILQTGAELFKDPKEREKARGAVKFAVDSIKAREIFDNYDDGRNRTVVQERWSQQTEAVNLEGNKVLQDVTDKVNSNIYSGKRINNILSEMQDYAQQDELFTGLFKDTAKQTLGKEDTLITQLGELAGKDDAESIKKADKIRRSLYNTIRIDTKVGLELAKFIKEMSGAAVSDEERLFLTSIMQGIMNGDAASVGTGLQAFRDARLSYNDEYIQNDLYRTKLPDTMYDALQSKRLSIDFEIPHTTSVVQTVQDEFTDQSKVQKAKTVATAAKDEVVKTAKEIKEGFKWSMLWGNKR